MTDQLSDGAQRARDQKQRNRSARSKSLSAWAQVAVAAISAVAVTIAALVAWQTQKAIKNNTQTALRQSEDSQLSTAITALGSDNAAERVAGLLLLARNTSGRFTLYSQTGEPQANVYDDYTTALQVLSGYLNSQSEIYLAAAAATPSTPTFGRGYGTAAASDHPIDITYAADQVAFLLSQDVQAKVARLHQNDMPAIDLGNDELYGQSWPYANFGWVIAYMPGIDLRGANLYRSTWGMHTTLADAMLQCADLQGADFRGANLSGADLRGAYVQGADFRGANLKFAKLAGMYGTATWSRRSVSALPGDQWNQRTCLQDSKIWDNVPKPPATTVAAQSTKSTARPAGTTQKKQ